MSPASLIAAKVVPKGNTAVVSKSSALTLLQPVTAGNITLLMLHYIMIVFTFAESLVFKGTGHLKNRKDECITRVHR